jgi:hypothetical protein
MQILFTNDFDNGGQTFTQAQKDSFLADEQTAINIYQATFTNNVTVTLNFGFGSLKGKTLAKQDEGAAEQTLIFLTYSQLRPALLASGQPGFFNAVNLPTGNSLNGVNVPGVSNFFISSSQQKALGLSPGASGPDGFIGIGTYASSIAPGAQRISVFLHEIGHALGRSTGPVIEGGTSVTSVSALDLVRFTSLGNRFFVGGPAPTDPTFFSIDGGATRLADWSTTTIDDFLGPPLTSNDSFNFFINSTTTFTDADIKLMEALGFRVTNPSPPPGTTAVMVLGGASNGIYQIYNIGSNATLAGYQLSGQVGADWQFVTLAGFSGNSTSDMLLRRSTDGAFQLYNVKNNNINIANSPFLGAVGLEWQVMGFGNFGSFGKTDMMLRDVNTGLFRVYNFINNQLVGNNQTGPVGVNWQFSGVGNFSGRGTSDLLLRNSDTGELRTYNVDSNQITGSALIGQVGLNWEFSGVGNFSSVPGESDLILRDSNTGALQIYDINNNRLTGSFSLGRVGLDWQFAGVACVSAPGASDLVLRNENTGAFQVYNIANNRLTGSASLGAVGLDWQLGVPGGFAANSPAASSTSMGSSDNSTSQLVQAMAGFGSGSGAGDGSNAAPLSADTSQQTLLTIPQHSA